VGTGLTILFFSFGTIHPGAWPTFGHAKLKSVLQSDLAHQSKAIAAMSMKPKAQAAM
jgi:hypothetical protein